MPGLSFVFDSKNDLRNSEGKLTRSLDSMIHFSDYSHKVLLKNESLFLGFSGYEEYPVTILDSDEFFIYLEGRIYRESADSLDLPELARSLFGTTDTSYLTNWLLKTDGDFVLFFLEKKSGNIRIVNDALGRLPLYYHQSPTRLLVSREAGFIRNLIDREEIDRMAVAQSLLFGYSLGKRTLFEEIYRLKPASRILIDNNGGKIEVDAVYQFNFDVKASENHGTEANASRLAREFAHACGRRSGNDDYKNVLSLSGGLDSRAVGAGLKKQAIPFSGATFLDAEKKAEVDVELAEKLAGALGIGWQLFRLGHPQGKDLLTLLEIKNGLNYLGMGFILSFFRKITEAYGKKIIYFTGDGGDKALPGQRARRKITGLDVLVKTIVDRHHELPLDKVAAITGVRKNDILEEIYEDVKSYPEADHENKFVHFSIFERGFKLNFEGEDRNRFYFWSVAPFYSLPFFIQAMECPDDQKANYALYRAFLQSLSPEIAGNVLDALNKVAASSGQKMFLRVGDYLKGRLPRELKHSLRKRMIRDRYIFDVENRSNNKRCLSSQLRDCERLRDYLSTDEIERAMPDCTKADFDNLFTVASVIEASACGKSTIRNYLDASFS